MLRKVLQNIGIALGKSLENTEYASFSQRISRAQKRIASDASSATRLHRAAITTDSFNGFQSAGVTKMDLFG